MSKEELIITIMVIVLVVVAFIYFDKQEKKRNEEYKFRSEVLKQLSISLDKLNACINNKLK